jgi:pyrrolidone-carboxylate peptidase
LIPLNGAPVNNSDIIAKRLIKEFKDPHIKLVHCSLRTVYAKSFETLKDCVAGLDDAPDYILSLGQGRCKATKLELYGYNLNKSKLEDNDGVVIEEQVIESEGQIRFKLQLTGNQFTQSLSRFEKKAYDAFR